MNVYQCLKPVTQTGTDTSAPLSVRSVMSVLVEVYGAYYCVASVIIHRLYFCILLKMAETVAMPPPPVDTDMQYNKLGLHTARKHN